MIAELSELLCGFLPDWHWEVLIGKTNAGLILLIRGSCPPSIVTRQSFRMVAELNKQDSTVSSLSIPEGLPHGTDGAAAGGVPLGDDFLHVEGRLHREEHHLGQEEGEVEPGLDGTHGPGDLVKDLKRTLQEDTTHYPPHP